MGGVVPTPTALRELYVRITAVAPHYRSCTARRHAPGLNYAPLRDAAALFAKLSPHYPHVVILSQADRRQILVMERRAGGATARQAHTPGSFSVATPLSDALSKVAVRFTTRLESLARLSAGKRPDPHDAPLPLLFRASREVNASSQERVRRIFFRGSCTSKLRNRLARDAVATATGGRRRALRPWRQEQVSGLRGVSRKSLRARAARLLSRDLHARRGGPGRRAGRAHEAHMIRGKRLGGKRVRGGFRRAPAANETHLSHAAIDAQLPYANLGLRWGVAGAAATDDEIEALPARLAALSDVRRRLRTTARVRPLFTSNGARPTSKPPSRRAPRRRARSRPTPLARPRAPTAWRPRAERDGIGPSRLCAYARVGRAYTGVTQPLHGQRQLAAGALRARRSSRKSRRRAPSAPPRKRTPVGRLWRLELLVVAAVAQFNI